MCIEGIKMINKYFFVIYAALLLGGCAGVTDVVSTGPDTFMVASHGTMGWSSGPAQKAQAFTQANEYCQNLGKALQVISARDSGNGGFGVISSGEVSFKCISK